MSNTICELSIIFNKSLLKNLQKCGILLYGLLPAVSGELAASLFSANNKRLLFHGVNTMRLSYAKLWKLLIDNKMKKGDLFRVAEIKETAQRQLNHDEPVNMRVLMNVCKVFHCDIGDIVEFIEDDAV